MARRKKATPIDYIWAKLRISIGLIFLWTFFDKLFGLGFNTCRGEDGIVDTLCSSAWLKDGSPTEGFLNYGTKGPFADIFQSLAGSGFIDLLFMTGLLAIGIGLVFGIAMKLSVISGVTIFTLIWLASLWPEHHPFLDEHIIYSIVLVGLLMVNNKQALGFGQWWKKQKFVKEYPILE